MLALDDAGKFTADAHKVGVCLMRKGCGPDCACAVDERLHYTKSTPLQHSNEIYSRWASRYSDVIIYSLVRHNVTYSRFPSLSNICIAQSIMNMENHFYSTIGSLAAGKGVCRCEHE